MGGELRKERSANFSLAERGKGKGTNDQRNEFCRVGEGGDIYERAKVRWLGNMEDIVCNRD